MLHSLLNIFTISLNEADRLADFEHTHFGDYKIGNSRIFSNTIAMKRTLRRILQRSIAVSLFIFKFARGYAVPT